MSARIAGLYAVTPDLADTDLLCVKVEAALSGGAAALQYRNKSAPSALRRAQSMRLHALCRRYAVPLVLNDDVSLALEVGADGIHLGKEDEPVQGARARMGEKTIVGVSCYDSLSRGEAAARAGADYLAFGSAFSSRVKPDAVHASLELYREARRRFDLPIVAIGGITLDNASALLDAGVDAIAVISALFDAPDVQRAAQSFTALFPGLA